MDAQQTHRQPRPSPASHELKRVIRSMWAAGNYHEFAQSTVWELGPVLVDACGIAPGQRVLDVAAGTGNVAIRAAQAGAEVVACDLTPENFEAGRRAADHHGVEVEWTEGDAEDLPFDDESFDVVTSCFGALFAFDQRAVAREMLRVCRPGGTIGMINFRPTGTSADFFTTFARHAPPPPGTPSPTLWGSEPHVRNLFGDQLETLDMTHRDYIESAASPMDYCDLFHRTFGPIVALRSSLASDPDRLGAFDRDFLDFANRCNVGPNGGPAEYRYDYLLVIARKRGAKRRQE